MRRTLWVLACLSLVGCDDAASDDPLDGGTRSDARPGLVDGFVPDGASEVDLGEAQDAGLDPDSAESDAIPPEGVLLLDPPRATLELSDGPPPTAQFTAQRAQAGADPIDLDPTTVAWSVLPQELGVVDVNGLFTSAGREGGGQIEARIGGQVARAAIEIASFEDLLAPGTPADTPDRFDAAPPGEGCAPELLYPEALTAFPRNITGVDFQWRAGGHQVFELAFTAGPLAVRWYTNDTSLIPEGDAWDALLRNASGDTLRFTLRGLGGSGDQACATAEFTYFIDPALLQGAIYYWSTGDFGIMRLAAGDTAPEPFLNPAVAPQINCPACHALSRDGSRIAYTRTSFPPFGDLSTALVDAPADALYDPTGVVGYFPSFAPDNVRIVGGANGQLVVRNVDTGAEIERLPLLPNTVGGSPDWSWQGGRIVAAVGAAGLANPLPDVGISGGSIVQWHDVDGLWSMPDTLVEAQGEFWFDRPAYDPLGEYIAFNQLTQDPNPDDDANTTAELMLIPSEGGAPVALARANKGPGLGNAWPKWSPTDRRGRRWLAFSSLRAYGSRVNQGERPQIWVTGIDPDAAPGADPSSPGFWLPYQNTESGNHIPYWAVYSKNPEARPVP